MMDEEIQQDDKKQENNSDSTFWSPWAIIFLGVPYAILNWWRMGNKRKGIAFMLAFVCIQLLNEWLSMRSSVIDLQLQIILVIVRIIIWVTFYVLLIDFVRLDIREFRWSGKKAVPTHWTIVFIFAVVMIVPAFALNYSLYFLPVSYGYCPAPKFHNLAYQIYVANRIGPEKIFLNRNDFGCDWLWFDESSETKNTVDVLQTYQYDLDGGYFNNEIKGVMIRETVYVFEQSVKKEHFDEFITKNDGNYSQQKDWSVVDTSKYDVQDVLSETRCRGIQQDGGKTCIIYLASKSTIIRISLTLWADADKLNQQVMQATQKTAQRLLAYNQSP